MEAYVAKVISFDVVKPQPPQPEVKAVSARTLEADPPKPVKLDDQSVKGSGQPADYGLGDAQLIQAVNDKLRKAMNGEMDFDVLPKGGNSKEAIKAKLQAAGIKNPTDHNVEVYEQSIKSGKSPDQAVSAVRHDPIVFDLNGTGKIDANVNQHGINVDGSKDTKWAPKGDGVLSWGDQPLDTEGGKYSDAYANLKAKAEAAGIDTSKGYLDKGDIAKLEEKGLTMLVSNGDGTNQKSKPSELGITKMSLGGQAVHETDSSGNLVTTKGSFERNGKTQLAEDMWLNEVPANAKNDAPVAAK